MERGDRKRKHSTHPCRALVPGAVALVDEHWIAHIVHGDILKVHIGGSSSSGSRPGLDPDAVHGAGDGAVLDKDSDDWLFALVLPEAANTYAVAWATGHGGDVDLLAAIPDGDAVVSCLDVGVHNGDPIGSAYVDPICVGAVSGGNSVEMLEGDVLAAQDNHMELLAVQGGYTLD